jgi:hypothetical protein
MARPPLTLSFPAKMTFSFRHPCNTFIGPVPDIIDEIMKAMITSTTPEPAIQKEHSLRAFRLLELPR